MFSWSGNKASVLGGASLYGPLGLNFWTKTKTITSLWREDAKEDKAAVAMPVHHWLFVEIWSVLNGGAHENLALEVYSESAKR